MLYHWVFMHWNKITVSTLMNTDALVRNPVWLWLSDKQARYSPQQTRHSVTTNDRGCYPYIANDKTPYSKWTVKNFNLTWYLEKYQSQKQANSTPLHGYDTITSHLFRFVNFFECLANNLKWSQVAVATVCTQVFRYWLLFVLILLHACWCSGKFLAVFV